MTPAYRLLIADDSAATRAAFKEFVAGIAKARFEVLEAEDGVQALKILTGDSKVDLVVTDMGMPKLDGVQLIRKLRDDERFANMPILALTASDDEKRKVAAFRAGATDYVVKPFLAEELELRIMGHLQRKRAYETMVAQEHALAESLEQARLTQASLLPSEPPRVPGLSIAVKYAPAEHLGGDYYDFFSLPDGRLGILLADVSGHGLPAALITFLLAGVFRQAAMTLREPQELLRHAGEVLSRTIPKSHYATAFYATYRPSDRILSYSCAGHPPVVLIRPGTKEIKQVGVVGTPLAMDKTGTAYERGELALQPGDRLFLHSDALLDVEGPESRTLGFARLRRFLLEHLSDAPTALLEAVYAFGLAHSDARGYNDDLTMILVEVTAVH